MGDTGLCRFQPVIGETAAAVAQNAASYATGNPDSACWPLGNTRVFLDWVRLFFNWLYLPEAPARFPD